ncbi:MAG TPA: ABC transporter permease [Bdellovibrionales bacterium]|nr:ABC transporter permease [Bdellovibrionales bacterium]
MIARAAQVPEGYKRLALALAALLTILLFNFFFTQGFFQVEFKDGRLYGSLIDVLNRAAPAVLVTFGMTLVIATGGVDLSVGAVCAIAGSVAAVLLNRPEPSLAGAIALPLLVGVAAGLWNGLLVAWLQVPPIVATLVLMAAGRGIAQLLTEGQVLTFTNPGFSFLGSGFFLTLPFSLTLVAAVYAVTIWLARRSAAGLFIEAVGNNPEASRFAGVNTRLVKMFVYAFSGLCSALAGLIIASDINAADANNAGLYLELDAILAAVIGGTALTGGRFSVTGALVGALINQAITTTVNTRGVPAEVTLVIKALVIVALGLAQSPKFMARLKSWRRA